MDRVAQQLINRLQRDPNDHPAYEALKDHYRSRGDLASLVNLVSGWAMHTADPTAAARAFSEAGDVLAQVPEQHERAVGFYQEALTRDALCRPALAGMQRVYAVHGHYRALSEWLSQHIGSIPANQNPAVDQVLAELYTTLGKLFEQHLAEADNARECYARAAVLNGAGVPGGGQATASDYTREVDGFLAKAEAAAHAGDLDGAIVILRDALRQFPGDVQVMHQLSGYLLQRADQDPDQPDPLDLRRAAELLYQIAQGLLDTPEESLPYLEAALEAAPGHEGALSLLEHVAPQLGQHDRLAGHWVAYLAVAGPGPEADRRRLALGRAYAVAGQTDDAIYCLEQLPRNNAEAAALLSSLVTQPETSPHEVPGGVITIPGGRRRRPTPSESKRADDAARIATLHKEVHRLVAANLQEEAADRCRDIIDIDPTDPEAYFFLESHYRKLRAFSDLRELLLASTRTTGLPVDTRRERLLEVAQLSERKLGDADTAIAALQSVVTLSSADSEAARNLKRLLKSNQRWDELVDLLERETLSTTTANEKATLLEELARLHRDQRGDMDECIQVLFQIHELQPDNGQVRDRLIDALMDADRVSEAVPLLLARVREQSDPEERVGAMRDLLSLCEQRLRDDDLIYEVADELLGLQQGDMQALHAMERIDEARNDSARLVQTLSMQAQASTGSERSSILMRVAGLYDASLENAEAAAQAYTEALEADPGNDLAATSLSDLFERAGKHKELADLLEKQAQRQGADEFVVACLRQLARISDEMLADRPRATRAYERVLSYGEDLEALEFLSSCARDRGDSAAEAGFLERLHPLLEAPERRRDTLYDLALLQRDDLSNAEAAEHSLTQLLEVDPTFAPAFEALREVAEARGSKPGQRLALRCAMVARGREPGAVAAAKELSELCGQEPVDLAQQRMAFEHWAACDPTDPEPTRRLVPLLEQSKDNEALRDVLDSLAEREPEATPARLAALRAARIAFERLDDCAYAWDRLQPWVEMHDAEACELLHRFCTKLGWIDRLANLHITKAQAVSDAELQKQHWSTAAALLSDDLGDGARGLQAALRALAVDMTDQAVLEQVEELCVRTGAYERLDQVYDRLVKNESAPQAQLHLLLRHASLLERAGFRSETAFAQLAKASALEPEDESLLDRMEALAAGAKPQLPMLGFYEQRVTATTEPHDRVSVLLRAARFCENRVADRTAAMGYLARALAEGEQAPELLGAAVDVAKEFDEARPDLGDQAALRALIHEHRSLAKTATPEFSRVLLLQSAALLETELGEPRAALEALRAAMTVLPEDAAIFDEAKRLSSKLGRLDSLVAHLVRLASDAVDAGITVALLRRQADLLENELDRAAEAVGVFNKLVQLRPNDSELSLRLRTALKNGGRYQELLVALKKQLERVGSESERIEVLRDIARTWDGGLRSRYEALDAWQKVKALRAEDEEAAHAIERLSQRDKDTVFADAPWGPRLGSTEVGRSSPARSELEPITDVDRSPFETGTLGGLAQSPAGEADDDDDDDFDLDALSRSLRDTSAAPVDELAVEVDEEADDEVLEVTADTLPHALLPRPAARSVPPPPPPQSMRPSLPPRPSPSSLPPPLPSKDRSG